MDSIRCPNGGKVAFGTKSDAVNAKRAMDRSDLRHGRTPDSNLRVYECPKCRLWHVGHDKFLQRRGPNP